MNVANDLETFHCEASSCSELSDERVTCHLPFTAGKFSLPDNSDYQRLRREV